MCIFPKNDLIINLLILFSKNEFRVFEKKIEAQQAINLLNSFRKIFFEKFDPFGKKIMININ